MALLVFHADLIYNWRLVSETSQRLLEPMKSLLYYGQYYRVNMEQGIVCFVLSDHAVAFSCCQSWLRASIQIRCNYELVNPKIGGRNQVLVATVVELWWLLFKAERYT